MGENLNELFQSQANVWNNVLKFFHSMSLKCVVELGIPDIIHSHGQPRSLSSLVAALHIEPTKAQYHSRLMRLLIHSGFFTAHGEAEDVKYSLTPSSKLLLNHSQATPFLFLSLDKATIASWQSLSSWFCSSDHNNNNGQHYYSNAFEMANGKLIWDYAAQEPSFANLFPHTMVCDSELIGKIVKEECGEVFEELKSLVDVGGGTGVMGKAIGKLLYN